LRGIRIQKAGLWQVIRGSSRMKGNAEVGLFGVKLTRNDHLGQLLPTNRQSGFVNTTRYPRVIGAAREFTRQAVLSAKGANALEAAGDWAGIARRTRLAKQP